MTLASNERISAHAAAAVTAFFDAYRRHDVEAMVELCTENTDFEYVPFNQEGGVAKAAKVFGTDLPTMLDGLNAALAVTR